MEVVKDPFDIHYIIISKKGHNQPILPPSEFDNPFLDCMAHLPKNILQLNESFEFIGFQWTHHIFSGYDLTLVYEENLFQLEKFSNSSQVTVVFIDTDVQDKVSILAAIKRFKLHYVLSDSDQGNEFSSPRKLIAKLFASKKQLSDHFISLQLDVDFDFSNKIPDAFKDYNTCQDFLPARSNECTLNQYIGNFWYENEQSTGLINKDGGVNEAEVKKASARKNRMDILINQMDNIDKFKKAYINKMTGEADKNDYDPFYVPLILICPYQLPNIATLMPGIEKIDGYDLLKKAYKIEQNIDYKIVHEADKTSPEESIKTMQIIAPFISRRSGYLDILGYLHSCFTYSPVVRLPLLGPSLNNLISFFYPNKTTPGRRKFLGSIIKFGKEYVERAMSPDLIKRIAGKNRQIVVIGDLPAEWFSFKGIPLSFTHDITRLPEYPYGGLMALYIRANAFKFQVGRTMIKKTLVVLGVPTDNGQNIQFDLAFKVIEARGIELGFEAYRCSNVNDLSRKIKDIQPDLLILDSHGRTNEVGRTTEIQIGQNWITGDDIVKFQIGAPLVILSACNTIPNGGFINPIINAFFQVGCLSITGTYLPIGILDGTNFYHRILSNLAYCQNKSIHANWLNFLSHNIRSQYIHEAMIKIFKMADLKIKVPRVLEEVKKKASDIASNLSSHTMFFSRREHVFSDVIRQFSSIHSLIKLDLNDLPLEQLRYSNFGRGDLISFESWRDKNFIKNS